MHTTGQSKSNCCMNTPISCPEDIGSILQMQRKLQQSVSLQVALWQSLAGACKSLCSKTRLDFKDCSPREAFQYGCPDEPHPRHEAGLQHTQDLSSGQPFYNREKAIHPAGPLICSNTVISPASFCASMQHVNSNGKQSLHKLKVHTGGCCGVEARPS